MISIAKNKLLLGILSVVLLIIIWQFAAFRVANRFLLPYPIDVWHALINILLKGETYRIILHSFARLLTAMTLATLVGVCLGLLGGFNRFIDYFFRPLVTSLRTVPVASIIVVILILYGSRTSLYIITFVMLFPIIYEATKQGVLNIDRSLIEALSLEEERKAYVLRHLYFPLSMPFIKTGLLQSIGLGFKVLVMAEFIAQSPVSIGNALYRGRINLEYANVFAWTIIIIFIVIIIEQCVNKLKTHQ